MEGRATRAPRVVRPVWAALSQDQDATETQEALAHTALCRLIVTSATQVVVGWGGRAMCACVEQQTCVCAQWGAHACVFVSACWRDMFE